MKKAQLKKLLSTVLKPFDNPEGGENPYQIQGELQDKMQEFVGIARSQESLTQALEEVQTLREEKAENVHTIGNREYNSGWHTALDLDCLLTVSESIALAALERKASIGAHSRDDFPEREEDGAGKYNTILKKAEDGTMAIRREPVPELNRRISANY